MWFFSPKNPYPALKVVLVFVHGIFQVFKGELIRIFQEYLVIGKIKKKKNSEYNYVYYSPNTSVTLFNDFFYLKASLKMFSHQSFFHCLQRELIEHVRDKRNPFIEDIVKTVR